MWYPLVRMVYARHSYFNTAVLNLFQNRCFTLDVSSICPSHLKSGFLFIILDTSDRRVRLKTIKRVVPGGIPLN